MKYASDFPPAEDILEPNRPITWVNQRTWRKDKRAELDYCKALEDQESEDEFLDEVKQLDEAGMGRILRNLIVNNDDASL